jgi:hypothetical protein
MGIPERAPQNDVEVPQFAGSVAFAIGSNDAHMPALVGVPCELGRGSFGGARIDSRADDNCEHSARRLLAAMAGRGRGAQR